MTTARIVIRRERMPRAIAFGVTCALLYMSLGVAVSVAAGWRTYADTFPVGGSYTESTGSAVWNGPWVEVGDDGSADAGAFKVESDPYCAWENCLVIGKGGSGTASITRPFDSAGASSVRLGFLYRRHIHGAGVGEVRLLASTDGSSFTLIKTYPLTTEDSFQRVESIDISAFASVSSAIRFEVVGSTDSTHLNVDVLSVFVDTGSPPSFDQDLPNRTDPENTTINIASSATDAEPGPLVYSASGLPSGVAIDSDTGLISGVIDYSAAGASPYSVHIRVADSDGNVSSDTFTWTVTNVNRPPSAGDRAASVAEDDPVGVTIDLANPGFVSDPDGDAVTVGSLDVAGLVGGTVVDNGDGTVTYTPDTDYDGSDTFSYVVTDGIDSSVPAAVTIAVTPSEDDPTLAPIPTVSVPEGALAAFSAIASDPDTGDSLVYSLIDGPDTVPAGASVDASGSFTWLTDEADGPGTYDFELRVTDSTNRFVEQSVRIEVSEANEAPILDPIADRVDSEGAAVSVTMTVTDPDIPAPALTYSVAGLPFGLTIDSVTGEISGTVDYSAAAGSPYAVTISVHDDHLPPGVDSQTFTWTIIDVNRSPVISGIPADALVTPGDAYSGVVTASDPDGDTLTFTASGLPPGLTIDTVTGAISGTVGPAATGAHPVSVVVTDTAGADDSASFVITISPPMSTTTTTQPVTTTTPPVTTTTVPTTTSTTTTTVPVPAPNATTGPPSPVARPSTPTTVRTSSTTTILVTSADSSTTTSTLALPTTTSTNSSPQDEPSVGVPEPMTRERAHEVKEDLVVAITADTRPPPGSNGPGLQLTPREGLSVTFVAAVETLRTQFASAVLLGIGIAVLLMLGIDRRETDHPNGVAPT